MKTAALLLLALVLPASCAAARPPAVDFSDRARTYAAGDYEEVYERWTRHTRVLTEVDVALEGWATYKSWDYREAYIERYASIYSLSPADRAVLRQGQSEAYRQAYEFHLTAQSASYKWNDLEKRDSPWRVTLVDGLGHELSPEYVRMERLPDAYERAFYPAKTPFSKSYAVRFPVSASMDGAVTAGPDFPGTKTGRLTLRIASPLGRLEMTWQSAQ